MSNHRAIALVAAGLATFAAATSNSANADPYDGTITFVNVHAWGGNGQGGPFAVSGNPSSLHLATGQHGAEAGQFITFCIERNETIREGWTYDVRLNDKAIQGGAGGGNPDPLDARTAFLYTKFVEGTLADDFNAWHGSTHNFNYLSSSSGIALQDAIWTIEQEDPSYKNKNFALQLVEWADEAVAIGGEWYGKGLGSVRVMNLYRNDEHHQDQLTFVPLPAPLALAAAGLLGIGVLRRRRGLITG